MTPETPTNIVTLRDVLAVVGILFGIIATILGALVGVVYNKIVKETDDNANDIEKLEADSKRIEQLVAQYQASHVHLSTDLERAIEDLKFLANWRHKIEAEHNLCFRDYRDSNKRESFK